jgi:hypothetical protein
MYLPFSFSLSLNFPMKHLRFELFSDTHHQIPRFPYLPHNVPSPSPLGLGFPNSDYGHSFRWVCKKSKQTDWKAWKKPKVHEALKAAVLQSKCDQTHATIIKDNGLI